MSSTSLQLQKLSDTELGVLINQRARFKSRSHDTHTQTHQPQLVSSVSTIRPTSISPSASPQMDIVLLGDSMLERFKTSGMYTDLGQLPYPQLFNAGVGGDMIENVLYRVDLQCQHLDDYYLLLHALLKKFQTRRQILVTGLFQRKDVEEQCIKQSNIALEELVARVNIEETEQPQDQCIHWMAPPKEIGHDHLEDNVHLNTNGYKMWNAALYPKIQKLLSLGDYT